MEIDSRLLSRGETVVNYPMDAVCEFISAEGCLKKLNDKMVDYKCIKNFEDKSGRVVYMEYKGVWPVANRDFVNVGMHIKEEDGTFYMPSRHCEFGIAEKKGIVRGVIHIGGYVVKKVDENSCHVTYISDVDIKGSVPAMIKNMLAQNQGTIVTKIEPTMKK